MCRLDHHVPMEKDTIGWRGWGRWLAFLLAGLLVLLSIPMIFDHQTGASAGWNIFLGLLLAGSVGSGHRHAPRIAMIIAILLFIRVLIAAVFVTDDSPLLLALTVELLLAVMAAVVALDLRHQARGV
ncbi:hypothetical protein [Sphingomonas sp. SRS2]|uniref:hypothetical protein n=1 Tax=Sphingomonas sp. SRS2 TaxID=133190 RepID=UPI00061E3A5A|nr:hypothetical protein [Sphingomonas sp. SRS2]KKC25631.1 hypothetical protein WP12_12530 [Sphingomonas sp. SRS2]